MCSDLDNLKRQKMCWMTVFSIIVTIGNSKIITIFNRYLLSILPSYTAIIDTRVCCPGMHELRSNHFWLGSAELNLSLKRLFKILASLILLRLINAFDVSQ